MAGSGTVSALQFLLGAAASNPQHAVRKAEFDSAISNLNNLASSFSLFSSSLDDTTSGEVLSPVGVQCAIITIGAGSSGYSETITLDNSSVESSGMLFLLVKMPASTNPTITVTNGSTIEIIYGSPVATDYLISMVYDYENSTWHRLL